MPITLEAARSACQQGRWHAILVVPPGASANEICRARRRLQLTEHIDKGGCAELSQLISQAADELLTRCPKPWAPTEGLSKRDAHKAARLDELRPLYQKAYDRLRYVRRTGKPEDFAHLCVQRLLAQAWGALLDMPAPLVGDEAIVMADWQGFSL